MTPREEGPLLAAVVTFAEDVMQMVNEIEVGSNVIVTKGWPADVEWRPQYVVTVTGDSRREAVLRYLHDAGYVGRFTTRGVGTVWFKRTSSA